MTLSELRESRGWSQAMLSAKSGVSQSYVGELESGSKNPTLPILAKLAAAFGMPVYELVKQMTEPKSA